MAYYPNEIIDEITSRIDIVDLISEYVRLNRKGRGYEGLCPFHTEKTPSFKVDGDRQIFKCFGCGIGGNAYTFLMQYENIEFPEAVEQLASRCGIELPKRDSYKSNSQITIKKNRQLEIHKKCAEYYYKMLRSEEGKDAYAYFIKRGLNKDLMQRFGLGFTGKRGSKLYPYLKGLGFDDKEILESGLVVFNESKGPRDRFWNRAMFPIMDTNNKVIAFGGRVMGEGEPKYLNSSETIIFEKSRTLYGLNIAKRTRRAEFILCEGYMDVIALHGAGFDNAIATLGTALTSGHVNLLRRYKKPILMCYDSDKAGQNAIVRGFGLLREYGLLSRVINLLPYKDPDEFIQNEGEEAFEKRIKEAENAFIYILKLRKNDYDLKDPAQGTAFMHYLADELLSFEEKIERDIYIESVSKELDVSFEALKDLVYRQGTKVKVTKTTDTSIIKAQSIKSLDPHIKTQLMFLNNMCEPRVYEAFKDIILTEDYTDDFVKQISEYIYQKMDEDGLIEPSSLLNRFDNIEEQNFVSNVFFNIEEEELDNKQKAKGIKETAKRIKTYSLDSKIDALDTSDARAYQEAVDNKMKILGQIDSLDFSIE